MKRQGEETRSHIGAAAARDVARNVERALGTSIERARIGRLQAQAMASFLADADRQRGDAPRGRPTLDPAQQACLELIRSRLESSAADAVQIETADFMLAVGLDLWGVRRALKGLRLRGLIRASGTADDRRYAIRGEQRLHRDA